MSKYYALGNIGVDLLTGGGSSQETGGGQFDNSFKFGDIVENYWASERNPIRKGIVIRIGPKSLYLTDGKGKFWNLVRDSKSKTKIIGSITFHNKTKPNDATSL